jgi:hypothetical protein
VAVPPGATFCAGREEVVNRRSWDVPDKATLCVSPPGPLLLSAMVRVPVRFPPAVGAKLTLIVQLEPAATLAPQVLVWEKFALTPIEEMVSA